ncbi:hypothetical protein EC957_007567, partial [Mortierella hygrophila]
MGISVLPSWIKEASDGIEEDLTQRTCHVDFPAMFFALLNSRAFYGTVNIEARKARLHHSLKATVATNAVELGSPSIKHARLTLGATSGTSSSTGPVFVAIPPGSVPTNLMTQVQHLLQGAPTQIFLDSNGALTTTRTENKDI